MQNFALAAVLCFVHAAHATESPALTLFENVRIFDGKSEALSASMNVLVRGNIIEKISKDPIPIDGNSSAKIIAGGGRTLMPGLIDAHWHTMLVRPTPTALLVDDVGYLNLLAGAEATDTLMRGFTTVRDMGGPSFDSSAPSTRVSSLDHASIHPVLLSRSPVATATSAIRLNCLASSAPR